MPYELCHASCEVFYYFLRCRLTPSLISPQDTARDPSRLSAEIPFGSNGRPSFEAYTLQLRFAAIRDDGGPPIEGGAASDTAKASEQKQTRDGNLAVLPLADVLLFSGLTQRSQSAGVSLPLERGSVRFM